MQLTTPRGNFIEKIVRDAQGRIVRATFCVYEDGGHIKARLVSAVLVGEKVALQNKILTLAGLRPKVISYETISFDSSVISPFFNIDLLHSLGSKPRAPTFN